MTRVSYNVISAVGNTTLYTGIKSYPQAAVMAANVRGNVVTVYTPTEIKETYKLPEDRLTARLA